MALPQNPQDFLCPGVEQPPITQYEPLAEGHPYGCIIINFYNGTQPITREIWIEGLLNVTQDVFDFCEWAVGWGSGTSFGTTAMFEILCKTHSPGENLPIAFSWYDYDVAGNLINTPSQTEFVKSFPKEFQSGYRRFQNDANERWQTLDPHYSSALLLNEMSIPTYFYLMGGILDYEKYQDNELERNDNLLKYLNVN